jgi:hypothetical protein
MPTAITGRTQPRRRMFTRKRIVAKIEISTSRSMARSWTLTSV